MTTTEISKIIEKILEDYNFGAQYSEFEFNGINAKVRMNKDHARNHGRNDDSTEHNLSLINVYGNGASEVDSFFEHEDTREEVVYIQKQVWGVVDHEDVKKEVEAFIEDLKYAN